MAAGGLRLTLLLLLPAPAWAGDFEAELGLARAAVLDGDAKAADKHVDAARDAVESTQTVILADQAASPSFYRGVLAFQDGDSDAAMDHWRRTLTIAPRFVVDVELLPQVDGQDLFEALRSEMQQAPMSPPGVDDEAVGVRVYVSGQLMHSYDLVYQGEQLVQVLCPDDALHSWWHVYGDAPDYAAACALPRQTLSIRGQDPADTPALSADRDGSLLPYALLGGGALLVAGGATAQLALARPAYAQVEAARAAPDTVSREQADQLSADFNRARWAALGLYAAGGVVIGSTLVVGVDGQGVVLQGSF